MDDQICRKLDLYSSVASCSSGVELDRAQIVLFGNRDGAGSASLCNDFSFTTMVLSIEDFVVDTTFL